MIVAELRAEVRGNPRHTRDLGTVWVYNVGGTADVGEYIAETPEGRRVRFCARRGVSAHHVLAHGLLALELAETTP